MSSAAIPFGSCPPTQTRWATWTIGFLNQTLRPNCERSSSDSWPVNCYFHSVRAAKFCCCRGGTAGCRLTICTYGETNFTRRDRLFLPDGGWLGVVPEQASGSEFLARCSFSYSPESGSVSKRWRRSVIATGCSQAYERRPRRHRRDPGNLSPSVAAPNRALSTGSGSKGV